MQKKLEYADVREWALSNGFTVENGDGRLVAPYKDGQVAIERLERDIKVVLEWGQDRRVLVTVTPSRTHIDEHGMLQGAGLFSSFYVRYFDEGEGATLPVWFNAETALMIEERAPWKQQRDAGTSAAGPRR